jgi:hypothetical protein
MVMLTWLETYFAMRLIMLVNNAIDAPNGSILGVLL